MFIALMLIAVQAVDEPEPINQGKWFSSSDFPHQALKDDFGGKVEYAVDVDAAGNPTDCHILATSGHAILDQITCKTIIVRSRFEPAKDANGRPVSGTYKGSITWKKPDWSSQTYQATILDFSRDRQRPTCIIKREGELADERHSCPSMLSQEEFMKSLGKQYKLVAFLVASATNNAQIYRGEASWGERLSLIASDQYYRADGSFPFACVSVAAEGWEVGSDACAGFPGSRSPREYEKEDSRRSRSEISVFGVHR